jgi:hypothetical protein
MRRALWLAVVVLVCAVSTGRVQAASIPRIQGAVSGIELCPQSICGSAIFVGIYVGRVGLLPFTVGTVAVAVNHEPLPAPDCDAAITGGIWDLRAAGHDFRGVTLGNLHNNGDNTYTVTVDMGLTSGGLGSVSFTGTLDHNVFPPTIKGLITP